LKDYLQMTIETYDQIAENYINTTGDIRPQIEFETFCQALAPKGLVLDIGCAWGRDCKSFFEQGFSVIGVDLSVEMLKIAKQTAPGCSFVHADLRSLPLADNCVDGIWCCATLLHLKRSEVIKALLEFKRVLRVNAPCYIQVKKGKGEEIVGQSFSQGRPRFFTYFHEDELRELCLSAGFSIIDEHIYNEKDRHGPDSRDQEQLCFLISKI
jgi:ubiquinone/menaquinone biosynthesis C-methylase UbiE